jgi:hypothetical protein
MGRYLNPRGMTKAEWLYDNAQELAGPPKHFEQDDFITVVLVSNGPFDACALADSQAELEAFNQEDDIRFKRWFLINKDQMENFK